MEGPDDMPAHVKTAIIGPVASLPLPFSAYNNSVYLCEHRDTGGWGCGHSREVVAILETADILVFPT